MEKKSLIGIFSFNTDHCGIEFRVTDGRRLSNDETAILKSLGFAWHKKNHYYYTKYTDDKYELIKACCLAKDSQFPAKTKDKVMSEMAKSIALSKPKKEPKPKSTQAQQIADLTAQVAELSKVIMTMATAK